MIVDYLEANHNFGMRIEVSREEVLLDTGGGLKKAAWFFLEPADALAEPIDAVPFLSTTSMSSAPSISRAWCGFTRNTMPWPRSPSRTARLHAICSSTSR